MLWLAAYLTGFPPVGLHALCWTHGLAPMWSGLYLISTEILSKYYPNAVDRVNALSGLYLISTGKLLVLNDTIGNAVSMPSRAYTSFLRGKKMQEFMRKQACQCPLGLIPHFYGTPSKT